MAAEVRLNIETVEPAPNQHIHQWVYHVLRTNIIWLRLQPAQAISENEVSEFLGISRTPVREAFIRLAEDGLIKITPQKRTTVSPIDLDQAQEARFVRRAVEKAVIRDACLRLTDADRAELLSSIEVQRECRRRKSYERMLTVDNEYHRVIFRCCGKERSWLFLSKLDYNYDRLRTMVLPHVMDRVIDEHLKILEVITTRSTRGIDGIVDQHLTWAEIDKVVPEYPARYFTPAPRSAAAAPMASARRRPR